LNLGNGTGSAPEVVLNLSGGGSGNSAPEIVLNLENGGSNGNSTPELLISFGQESGSSTPEIILSLGNGNGSGGSASGAVFQPGSTGTASPTANPLQIDVVA